MKSNTFFVFMVFVLLIFCHCARMEAGAGGAGSAGEAGTIRIKTIAGVPHVYNPGKPQKGEVTLELEKVFELDSLTIDKEQPPSFSQFHHSGDRIFFFDVNQFKIYFFDAAGKLLNQFKIKGQGPGEIEKVTQFLLAAIGNDLWMPSDRKVIQYSRDGKLLGEVTFKKAYREISILDGNRFIGKSFIFNEAEKDEARRQTLSCVMFDRQEKIKVNYLEGAGLGGLPVVGQNPSGQSIRVIFALPVIVPSIAYGLDRERQLIYLCKTDEYTVFVKNLKGEMLRVIHRVHKNKLLSDEDRKEIVEQQLFRQPDVIKNLMAKNLPKSFCAVFVVRAMPHGYLAVFSIAGSSDYDIDIFDAEGRYIYRLKFPGGKVPVVRFYGEGGLIGIVDNVEDRDIYREYRIKNLPEIFGN